MAQDESAALSREKTAGSCVVMDSLLYLVESGTSTRKMLFRTDVGTCTVDHEIASQENS
jgi:hypothetical protein